MLGKCYEYKERFAHLELTCIGVDRPMYEVLLVV